jgi:hypothetical protein
VTDDEIRHLPYRSQINPAVAFTVKRTRQRAIPGSRFSQALEYSENDVTGAS